jgi:hypothetical protein
MAEDVHKQRIRAVAGIQFASFGVLTEQMPAGGGVCLRQATSPAWIVQDAPVGGGIEVTMPTILIRSIEDRWKLPKRVLMQESVLCSPPNVPNAQLLPQPKGTGTGFLNIGHCNSSEAFA